MRCFLFSSRRKFAWILSEAGSSVINKCASAREDNKKTSTIDSLTLGKKFTQANGIADEGQF